MKQIPNSKIETHQNVLLLLPWYVNGTLTDQEHRNVEQHLKICQTCRHEVSALKLISEAIEKSDSLTVMADVSFSQLHDRIEKSRKQNATKLHFPYFYIRLLKAFGVWLNEIFTLQTVIFAQAAIIIFGVLFYVNYASLSNRAESENHFRTLSSNHKRPLEKNKVRIVFSKNFNHEDILRFLDSIHATLEFGPSPQGVYVVRIETSKFSSDQEISDYVAKLRNDNHVVFAEPAYSVLVERDSK